MADANNSTHTCCTCKELKPASEFAKRKGVPGSKCRACHKVYVAAHYQKNKEKYKARAAQWREDNRERYLENNKRYYEENKEVMLAKSVVYQRSEQALRRRAKWAAENKEKRLAAEAAYRERNRAVCNERIREWKAENVPLVRTYSRKRSKKKRIHTPAWASREAMKEFYADAIRLTKETGIQFHVDHIVPIVSDIVCGLHCEANMQVLTYEENIRKGNRHWPDMP